MATGVWYDVQDGESVESIAVSQGCPADKIWAAPENKDLKKLRETMHILQAGDRLFIPALKDKVLSLPTGKRHKIVVKKAMSKLHLVIRRQGEPFAGKPYQLLVDGQTINGQTAGDGTVEAPVPASAKEAVLTVGEGDEAVVYRLGLRELDPLTSPSGLRGRLANLGFHDGDDGDSGGAPDPSSDDGADDDSDDDDESLDKMTEAALCAFQDFNEIDVSGTVCDATKSKLIDQHGR